MEALRDQRGVPWLADLVADVRYGCRVLARTPGFTLVAVFTLALGIGANTAVFTIADALSLRPAPFAQSERLYWIHDVSEQRRLTLADAVPPSPANFLDWRAESRSFDYMVAWRNWWFSVAGSFRDDAPAEQVRGVNVSPGFFDMLGVQAALGRTFRPDEEQPGREPVVVLTAGFWSRRFGSDPDIIGKTIRIDGRPFSVIGVLPSDFYFLWRDSAIFMPMKVDADFRSRRSSHSIAVLARLAPGVTFDKAQADLSRITGNLARAHPATNEGWTAGLIPVFPMNSNLRPVLVLLLAAVACVLLIACTNVTSLLLVRAGGRRHELAMRAALGASRSRLARQMLTETALLTAIGLAAGVAFAAGGVRLLLPFLPEVRVARPLTMAIDTRVLLFAMATGVLTATALGVLPALQAAGTEHLRVSAQSARRMSTGRALLTMQIALSLMLLIGATLLVRSLWNLQNVNPGFHPERALTMQLWLPEEKYTDPSSASAFYEEVRRRLAQFPEVRAAAFVNTRPFLGWSVGAALDIPGRAPEASGDAPIVGCRIISPDYLAALGVPLISGRSFTQHDGPETAGVALINQTLARRFWPTENPIGKAVSARTLGSADTAPWWPKQMTDTFTIVGIVGDIKESRLRDAVEPTLYLSYLQNPARYMHLLVRTASSSPADLVQPVLREIRAVDPDLGAYGIQTMESVLGEAVAEPKLSSLLLWVFAILALLLSAVGVYGVTSYLVGQRTREFAICMAMGARPFSVFRTVTREGVVVSVAGISIGVAGAVVFGRALGGLLYGVGPTHVPTLAWSAAVVLAVVLIACWPPAWRATKVDPIHVLRSE